MAEDTALAAQPAVPEISAVTCGVQTPCVNVWEEIFVHACKVKNTGFWWPFTCSQLSL